MNFVLATSPSEEDKHGVRSMAPLSLGYLAACVKKHPEATVRIVDAYGEGLTVNQAAERVLALSPDLLGVSSTSFCFPSGIRLISRIKSERSGVVTLMGGYHPTMFDSLLLKDVPALDLVIRGEGDESFPELCRRLLRSESLEGLPGLSYRANGQVVRGIPQQIEDLDAIPFPDRALFTYDGYFHQFGGFPIPEVPPTANVASSRGCPYHCTFCPKLFPQWRYRMRSAENVFQEVLELHRAGIKIAFFQDENFSYDIPRVEKICHLILEHNLKMRFAFQGTIHHLPESVFQLMHRAGFDALFVGVESGSDAQLKRYGKPATSKSLAEGIRRAKRAHMLVIGFFIYGGPGETAQDFEATQKFIQEVRPHICGGSALSIQPHAILWDKLIGDAEPLSLEDSHPRQMYTVPGQHSNEAIRRWRRGLRQAFFKSWRHWRRLIDILDLLKFNRSAQQVVKTALKDLKLPLGKGKSKPCG
ncbi:MAG: radical SAM protein [Deltaproteobacteria bacterium]|nr:radical SAM protein [Deltaproteobacteria bacterium]